MKKILNKIGKVLQVVLAAPVKWPGKAGSILKYIAVGLGILETVMEEEKPTPGQEERFQLRNGDKQDIDSHDGIELRPDGATMQQDAERSEADEME
ncbi:hypothetical protein D3C81_1347500 [compost metagenome]